MIVNNTNWLGAMAEDVINDPVLGGTPGVALFTNTPLLSPFTVLADFTHPVGGGYVILPLVISLGHENLPDGSARLITDPVVFGVTGAGPWWTANGYYVVNILAAPTDWLWAEYLPTPFTWTAITEKLHLTLELVLQATADWGTVCVC